MYIYDTYVTYTDFFSYEMLHYLKLYFLFIHRNKMFIYLFKYFQIIIKYYKSSYCIQSFVCILLSI